MTTYFSNIDYLKAELNTADFQDVASVDETPTLDEFQQDDNLGWMAFIGDSKYYKVLIPEDAIEGGNEMYAVTACIDADGNLSVVE